MPARNAARPGEGVEDPNRAAARAARGFSGSPGMYQVMSAQTYGRAVFGVWCLMEENLIASCLEAKKKLMVPRPFSDNPGPGDATALGAAALVRGANKRRRRRPMLTKLW